MNIKSLSISGLLTLDMHALNNEGAEGNHTQTRQVQIVDNQGKPAAVNAISGDMFKHIQAQHLHGIACEEELKLCNPCREFDANRIVADIEFAEKIAAEQGFFEAKKDKKTDSYILTRAIQECLLDDAEGILITSKIAGKDRSIARKSTIEFGWVIGRPETTRSESYFHVKFAPEGRGKSSGQGESNLGQNIFHRPANSGQYAVVVNVDLLRLGRNDITFEQAIETEELESRRQALLKSLMFTFVKPAGAQRNTQNPHILDFEGVISSSFNSFPAPTVSALNIEYAEEIKRVAGALNDLKAASVETHQFSSMGAFAEIMRDIITTGKPMVGV